MKICEKIPTPDRLSCELCFPGLTEIGWIGNSIVLFVNADGKYGLMGYQGHKGDEWLIFPDKPYPDPDPECNENSDEWIDKADKLDELLTMPANNGYIFTLSCKEAGFGKDTTSIFLAYWLFDHCGKMIENSKLGETNEIRTSAERYMERRYQGEKLTV